MAINKVDLTDGTILVDLTDATATADKIIQGYTAYGATGEKLTGTTEPAPDWSQATATAEEVLHGKTFYGIDGKLTTGIAATTTGQIYQDEDGYLVLDDTGADAPKWTRPSEWMPYAKDWTSEDFEGVYYVYDLALQDPDYPGYWSFYVSLDGNGSYYVDKGYVDTEGNYIIFDTATGSSNNVTSGLLPVWDGVTDYERYCVLRVTPAPGRQIRFSNFNAPQASDLVSVYSDIISVSTNEAANAQYCVEQYGRLPNVERISVNYAYRKNYTDTMIHSYLIDVGKGGFLKYLNNSFSGNQSLEYVEGLETWDTSLVIQMNSMFYNCYALQAVTGLEAWDTGNVTNFSSMFQNCNSLRIIEGLENWDVSSATNASSMFRSCLSLESLDLSAWVWSTSSAVNVGSMFDSCYSLKDLNITGWNLTTTSSLDGVFHSCRKIRELDLSGWDISNATSFSNTFVNCLSLQKRTFGNYTVSPVNMNQMFRSNTSIKHIDCTGWDFSGATNVSTVVYTCPNLVSLKGFACPLSFNITESFLLSADALVEILETLPTVTTAQTITLGSALKPKLTDAQIAIATEKGWTVA